MIRQRCSEGTALARVSAASNVILETLGPLAARRLPAVPPSTAELFNARSMEPRIEQFSRGVPRAMEPIAGIGKRFVTTSPPPVVQVPAPQGAAGLLCEWGAALGC